jgi:hypothetical protein
VTWDGGGGNGLWQTAANWNGDTLPGPSDDVVINAPGSPVITLSSGTATVRSLQCANSLVIAGGELRVTAGSSGVQGGLELTGGRLTVQGAGTSWTATGPTTLSGTVLSASGGAAVSLPALGALTRAAAGHLEMNADGTGSVIELAGVLTASVADYYQLRLHALGGAEIRLPQLATLAGAIYARADGPGSLVRLPGFAGGWTNATPGSAYLEARDGGAVLIPNVTQLHRINVLVRGAGQMTLESLVAFTGAELTLDAQNRTLPGLTNLLNSDLTVQNGAELTLPGVRQLERNTNGHQVLAAYGPGSVILLSNAGTSAMRDYYQLDLTARGGGWVLLPALTNLLGAVDAYAQDPNSLVDLSGLQGAVRNLTPGAAYIEARAGGIPNVTELEHVNLTLRNTGHIPLTQLRTFARALFTLDAAILSLPGLTNAPNSDVTVVNGARLSLGGIQSLTRNLAGDLALTAHGAGSQLRLPNASQSLVPDYYQLTLTATGGGQVLLPLFATLNGAIDATADQPGSLVDLPALQGSLQNQTPGAAYLEARNGGSIQIPNLTALDRIQVTLRGASTIPLSQVTTFTGGSLLLDGAILSLPALTDIRGTDLTVINNGQLNLANVLRLEKQTSGDLTLSARSGGILRLPNVETASVRDYYQLTLEARQGGQLYLPRLSSLTGALDAYAADPGSLIDLSGLQGALRNATPGNAYLEAANGGWIAIPNVTQLDRYHLTVRGASQIPTAQLVALTGSTVVIDNTQLAFGALADTTGTAFSYVNGGTAQFLPPADLQVTAILPPATAIAHQPVDLIWEITNSGTAITNAAWSDALFLSSDNQPGADIPIGLVSLSGGLANNQSRRFTNAVLFPAVQGGTWHLVVAANQSRTVWEGTNILNNTNISGSTLVIQAPDLVVDALSVQPAATQFGQPVTVAWTVRNAGTAPAPAGWTDRVHLSPQPDSLVGAVRLAAQTGTEPLAPGQSRNLQTAVTLPLSPGANNGNYHLIALTDADNTLPEAIESNNRRTTPLTLSLPPLPDLLATRLESPLSARPGQSIAFTWNVTNSGPALAQAPWIERLTITRTNAGSIPQALLLLDVTNHLASGAAIPRTREVPLPRDLRAGTYRAEIGLDADNSLLESNEGNNARMAESLLTVPAVLDIQLPVTEIAENASVPTITGLVSRNGDPTVPLTVQLTVDLPAALAVPATINMPAGVTTIPFTATAQADGVPNPDRLAQITATATGYQAGSTTLTVRNTDQPRLTLQFAAATVVEGDAVAATLGHDGPTLSPLIVNLNAPQTGRLVVPEWVAIPAGSSSLVFAVVAFDDSRIEPAVVAALEASAPGYLGAAASVSVLDNDVPTLSFSIATPTLSEGDGPVATTAHVSRTPPSPRSLSVAIDNSRPDLVIAPVSVIIPAGQDSVGFPVGVIDNTQVDGSRTATLQAFAQATTTNVRIAESLPLTLTLLDDDGPALRLTVDRDVVAEGLSPAATVTVSRNTTTGQPLVVSLSSSAPAETVVPSTITLPAGAASASAPLSTPADERDNGSREVFITAAAPGFTSATSRLLVTDVNRPDLIVTEVAGPGTALTEAPANLRYRVVNQGLAPAGTNWVTRLFLSPDPTIGNDQLVAEYGFTGSLPVGQFFGQSRQIRLPLQPGDYWVIATTDVAAQIDEIREDNNNTLSPAPIRVSPAYEAIVVTDLEIAPAGTPVPLRGNATLTPTGGPAPFVLVNLHLRVRGTTRIISALTDEAGRFATTFNPLPGEAGLYEIGAAHPGLETAPTQDSFTLVGLKPGPIEPVRLSEHSSIAGVVTLSNLGDLPLTGVQIQVLDAPSNLDVSVALAGGGTLPPLGTAPLGFAFAAREANPPEATVRLRVTSAEGAGADLAIPVSIVSLAPRLTTAPLQLIAGMKRGGQAMVEFDLLNHGGADSGPIQVVLPNFPWMRLATLNPLPSLAPGAAHRVTLQLLPPADLPLGPYTGQLALTTAHGTTGVPFEFRALSDARGDLHLTAVDEYTYFAEGAPKVSGASVTVRDAVTETIVASGVTSAAGEFLAAQLPEGYYDVRISADQHRPYRDLALVVAGYPTNVIAFLPREAVRYLWTVIPTEIQDRTRITIETTFEAFVPMPVITIDPPLIDLNDFTADVTQVDLKITNHGLIAAQKAELSFGTHPDWGFEPLISDLGDLPARSSLTVPLLVRKLGTAARTLSLASAPAKHSGGGGCSVSGACRFQVQCGPGAQGGSAPVIIVNASGNCGGGGGGGTAGSPGGGQGGGGAGGGGPGGSSSYVRSCDPCLLAILSCLFDFALDDFGSCVKDLYGCASSLNDAKSTAGNDAYNCMKAFFSCAEFAGKEVAKIPDIIDAAECIKGLSESCGSPFGGGGGGGGGGDGGGGGESPSPSASRSLSRMSLEPQFTQISRVERAELTILRQRSEWILQEIAPMRYLFGNDAWFTDNNGLVFSAWLEAFLIRIEDLSENGRRLSPAEITQLLNLARPPAVTSALARQFIDRWNRTIDYYAAGIFSERLLPAGYNPDFISVNQLRELAIDAQRGFVTSNAAGYPSPHVALSAAREEMVRFLGEGDSGGVCAHVRIRIDQEAVSARDAFNAALEIENALAESLDEIYIEVSVRRRNGEDATELFAVFPPQLAGISAVDGTGVLPPDSTGRAGWLVVPTVDAAPDGPEEFLVGGVLRYRQGQLRLNVPLAPASITVYPSPSLSLKYFHQRDVFADDPFTPEIEPSIPFSLAVMVQNHGRGTARDVRIRSAQPQIVDNEKGLLVDFKIIATEVAGQNLRPSLTVEFGQIPPGTNAIGRWLLTSTLLGGFIDYAASIEHLDGLGTRKLALVNGISIHELIRIVRAQGPKHDGRPDFLANDVADLYDRPDTLHLSDGTTEPVSTVLDGAFDSPPTPSDLQVQLTAACPPGWVYLRLPDPGTHRFQLARVVRSDGRELVVGENAWTTDRTFLGNARRPLREHILHLFDGDSTGRYTLEYTVVPDQDTKPPTSQADPLPTDSAAFIPVTWSGQDNPGGTGIAFFDVYVSIDNGPFMLWQKETIDRQAVYQGALSRSYAFYVVATDAAGNRELPPLTPDARTTVTRVNRAPTLEPVPDAVIREGDTWTFQPVAVDPDGDGLVFSISLNAPPGLTVNPYTGRTSWVTGEGSGPSSYLLTLQALDTGLPRLGATRSFNLTVLEDNSPPVLYPIGNYLIGEGRLLSITNRAEDYDLPPQQITFTLGPGAPPGATIDAQTGVFRWRPGDFQGGTTNRITLLVRDNGTPNLSASHTFTIVVRDTRSDFFVGIGSTNALANLSGQVPLILDSDADLAQLSFEINATDPHLVALELTDLSPEILFASLDPIADGLLRLQLDLDRARTQPGRRVMGTLVFHTLATGRSSVATLELRSIAGVRSSGDLLTNAAAQNGRLFLIENEPLLDAHVPAPGLLRLVVYGRHGSTVRLDRSPALTPTAQWFEDQALTLTDTFQILDRPLDAEPARFFRARRTSP